MAYRAISLHLVDGAILVYARTQWRPSNLTGRIAREELEAAKASFAELLGLHPSFPRVLDRLPIRYGLIDDYGGGAVELCHLEGGSLVWPTGFHR